MTYIFLSIIGIVAVVAVKSNWTQKIQIAFILSFIFFGLILFVVLDVLINNSGIEKGPAHVLNKISWLDIGLYFDMITGMIAKYFYDIIEKRRNIKFKKWQFIKPILVSPIVFGAVYGSIEEKTSIVLLLIFAFQNGFFWQTILSSEND